jgi:uncharacterized Zn finger protein
MAYPTQPSGEHPSTHVVQDCEDGEEQRQEAQQEEKEEAERYASQPERFRMLAVALEIMSDQGVCLITYDDLGWGCSCPPSQEQLTCIHIMAVQQLLKNFSLPQALGDRGLVGAGSRGE